MRTSQPAGYTGSIAFRNFSSADILNLHVEVDTDEPTRESGQVAIN